MGPLRWGIMAAGKISYDMATASAALSPKEHFIAAIAARSLESAREFADEFKIPKAYGSYEELVQDPEIDVCYIGTLNPFHLELGKLALSHGKHVLCEKPLGMNVRETKELIDYAREKGLFLMEGIWSRFFPTYMRLREEIDKGSIGDVLQVFVSFGVPISEVDRIKKKEFGGGSVLDIGIYCVQLAQYVFGGDNPVKIISGGHLNENLVDESTSTTLLYTNGRTATLVTHTKCQMPNEACIIGTKGTLKLECPFWCPTHLTLADGKTHEFPLPPGKATKFFRSMGLSYEMSEVRRCINAGMLESPTVSHKETLRIAEIMQSIRKAVDVVYPQDII
ncbi:trans-1,2-dihydrobenzene-1,2-diol dehydrogenase [Folsomia candida]|uniref:Trans-1,2-dihydrobenzene-1,2-diol dehydrogenase n=1 Tax=Folsomia candida TaxID=158441 RepID=A0A226E6P8_FOLCA|nr:trans-1,2-dihydrobenzene-1,2-diol dehydrogenase [Folsomia candida]OXA52541.1 hypothetical protein Fcan01_11913 [Folsomia candida]